jgi:L-threonylcarbamoyladenylate synthase
MKTLILKITVDTSDVEKIASAAELIRNGNLVAFPTETVYGLGANAFDRVAVEKIFAAKERPFWDPVISHLDSVESLRSLVLNPPEYFDKLVRSFMPGPLTILMNQQDVDGRFATASGGKISLRVPSHPIAQAFIKASGVPIAAPSANLFGRPSPTAAQHVLEDLDGRINAVIDAGTTTVGVESTVLDLTTSPPTILRPGGVTKEELEYVIGPVNVEMGVAKSDSGEGLSSPGMAMQHYSPNAKIILVDGQNALERACKKYTTQKIGVLLPNGWQSPPQAEIFLWGNWNDSAELAHNLFKGFRELDHKQVRIIVCPVPSAKGLGSAIRDRLIRAAAEKQ